MRALLTLALVPISLRAPTSTAPLFQDIVQPWTYRSPSGAIELLVDPSNRDGSGKASYRMTRGMELVWERELSFTLCDMLVLDDGSVGGYAYSEGVRGWGELVVAALNPDGSEQWEERTARVSPYPCSRDPIVYDLQPFVGGFGLELSARPRSDRWSTFGWSTGQPLKPRQMLPAESSAIPAPIVEVPVPPGIELSRLGRVDFPWPSAPPENGVHDERRYRQPHRVYVDWQDRVWISEFSSRVVHAFDSEGRPLMELTPEPWSFRPYRPLEWMAVRGDGHVFVYGDQAVQEFGPTDRVGRVILKDDSSPRWLFLPGTQERWAVEGIGRIQLYGAVGQLLRTVDRGANGRWFQDFYEASVARDGSLAVLDEPNPWISSRDPSTWVQLISPTGEACRSLRVPDEFNGYHTTLAFDGHRIALLHGRLLLLLNEDGSPIGRMTFSEELGEPYYLFFSPSGTELWVFPHMRHEMFRFALP